MLNRERFAELKAAEEAGGGKASVDAILRALVGPPLRWCLSPDRQRSAAARFLTRASVEPVPPIKKIVDREFRHLQRFAVALRNALPEREEVDIYWGLHFALAMSHHTIRERERLTKLLGRTMRPQRRPGHRRSRVVSVSVMALTGGEAPAKKTSARPALPHGRLTRQDL